MNSAKLKKKDLTGNGERDRHRKPFPVRSAQDRAQGPASARLVNGSTRTTNILRTGPRPNNSCP
jgi:hypothetical protein